MGVPFSIRLCEKTGRMDCLDGKSPRLAKPARRGAPAVSFRGRLTARLEVVPFPFVLSGKVKGSGQECPLHMAIFGFSPFWESLPLLLSILLPFPFHFCRIET
jgi:hypothetical protein